MSSLSLQEAIKPVRKGCAPIGAGVKGKKKSKGDAELPDFVSPPPKNAVERREWDRMSTRMEGFHSYFRQSFKQIWELADTFPDKHVSLPDYLEFAEQLVHHLEGHHGIEERYIFPVLAKRMPEFQDEHVEEHKKIHEGMHRYEQYIKAVRAEPSTYSPAKFREVMASWSNVLFYHLDAEVNTLREENLRRYYTLDEVKKLPMSDTLKDVPEFFEVELGESLLSRTETLGSFRELGPPDLCHVIKTTGKAGSKDLGSYHYVSGVDASSSASLAAYLNSLTYTVEEDKSWFFSSTSSKGNWKIKGGAFCSFNAFSRVDVRVEVKIPGGVDAYVIDLRGERHEATPQIWQEVYLSALLRSILYADDANYRLAGFRKLDPILTPEAEQRFIAAAEAAFFNGWQLGSEPEIQVATVVSNHLTSGLMKYFGDSFRFGPAVNLFEKLVVREGEVACLLAQSYLGLNEEVKAVRVLRSALEDHPQSYPLLHVQCDFLRSKGKTDWALQLAKQAVNCAPSEFVTWAKLTEVNMEMGRFADALLTLNSCPMFTYNERDLHRMPTPARSHLPMKDFIAQSGILDDEANAASNNDADVALLRLPAPSLRGTFSKAYALLAKLVSQIGWDELLKCRSQVFVMEEEYRMQKAADPAPTEVTGPGGGKEINGNGVTVVQEDDEPEGFGPLAIEEEDQDGADPAASTKAVASAPDSHPTTPTISISPPGADHDNDGSGSQPGSPAIPTIKVSTESDGEREREAIKDFEVSAEGQAGATGGEVPGLEKPRQAVQGEESEDAQSSSAGVEGQVPNGGSTSAFNNKRLCERWLDNLFMVLYEDLRVYTIWRAEVAHFKAQHLPYRKTGTEWEILGELAQRLHHKEEAKDAFQRVLDAKFSAKAWLKLLEFYADEGDVQRSLNAAIRLSAYQHRWYMESAYPTAVAHQLFKLIRKDGLAKISYSLVSMNVPQAVLKGAMQPYFAYAQTFRVDGYDF